MIRTVEEQQRAVVERLYAVFAAPVPRRITGCPCCIDTRNTDALLRTPLRAIDGEMLWPYVWSAFLTVGGVDDFRYLLPRILDVALHRPGESVDVEIMLGKLRLAGWDGWEDDARAAVIAAIDLLFDNVIVAAEDAEFPELPAFDIESMLCGLARADLDPAPWLERLRCVVQRPLLQQVWDKVSTTPNAFWDDAPDGLRSVKAWLAQALAQDGAEPIGLA